MEITVLLSVLVPVLTFNPKSVNLDLETSVLFEPKDAKSNTSLLNSVRKFLDDLHQVLDPKPNFRAGDDNSKFTDIIDDIAKVLLGFSDEEIVELTRNIYSKVKRLKLSDNDGFIARNLKQNIKNTLRNWTRKSPGELKKSIREYLKHEHGFFTDYITNKLNDFFDENDIKNMKSKLHIVTKTNNHKKLNEIVGKIVDFLLTYTDKSSMNDEIDKNEDIIVAGRLKKGSIDDSGHKEKSNDGDEKTTFKYKSKEVILDKNIEVFVRAAD